MRNNPEKIIERAGSRNYWKAREREGREGREEGGWMWYWRWGRGRWGNERWRDFKETRAGWSGRKVRVKERDRERAGKQETRRGGKGQNKEWFDKRNDPEYSGGTKAEEDVCYGQEEENGVKRNGDGVNIGRRDKEQRRENEETVISEWQENKRRRKNMTMEKSGKGGPRDANFRVQHNIYTASSCNTKKNIHSGGYWCWLLLCQTKEALVHLKLIPREYNNSELPMHSLIINSLVRYHQRSQWSHGLFD